MSTLELCQLLSCWTDPLWRSYDTLIHRFLLVWGWNHVKSILENIFLYNLFSFIPFICLVKHELEPRGFTHFRQISTIEPSLQPNTSLNLNSDLRKTTPQVFQHVIQHLAYCDSPQLWLLQTTSLDYVKFTMCLICCFLSFKAHENQGTIAKMQIMIQ